MSSVITPDLADDQEGLMLVGGSMNRGTGTYINGATVKVKSAGIPAKKAKLLADGLRLEKTPDGWRLTPHSKTIVNAAAGDIETSEALNNLVNEHAGRLIARIPKF